MIHWASVESPKIILSNIWFVYMFRKHFYWPLLKFFHQQSIVKSIKVIENNEYSIFYTITENCTYITNWNSHGMVLVWFEWCTFSKNKLLWDMFKLYISSYIIIYTTRWDVNIYFHFWHIESYIHKIYILNYDINVETSMSKACHIRKNA